MSWVQEAPQMSVGRDSKYRDSYPNKGSQNNANVENCKTVKLPLPPITLESFENNSSDSFVYFTFKKLF